MTDKQLIDITKQFTKGLTGGVIKQKCFIISSPLQSYLQFCGIETELIKGWVRFPDADYGHYWLKLKDGRILDPTAGQFDESELPKIYLGELPKHYTT